MLYGNFYVIQFRLTMTHHIFDFSLMEQLYETAAIKHKEETELKVFFFNLQ